MLADIPTRILGRTGLEVTILGYGANEIRGDWRGPAVSDDEAKGILNAVLDAGINYIDTSIDYGLSEARIGRFLANRRSEFYLATKCGCIPGGDGREPHAHDAASIRRGVENSLRLLRTDYLDVVQFHHSLPAVGYTDEGAIDALMRLKNEGKVRFIGVSGKHPYLREQIDLGAFDVFQVPYSALEPEHGVLIAAASATGGGIVIRGGLARGVPADWAGRDYYTVPGSSLRARWTAAGLDELTDGMNPMDFMLRYLISNPDLDVALVGTRNPAHLLGNLAAAKRGPLPQDLYAEVRSRIKAPLRGD